MQTFRLQSQSARTDSKRARQNGKSPQVVAGPAAGSGHGPRLHPQPHRPHALAARLPARLQAPGPLVLPERGRVRQVRGVAPRRQPHGHRGRRAARLRAAGVCARRRQVRLLQAHLQRPGGPDERGRGRGLHGRQVLQPHAARQ